MDMQNYTWLSSYVVLLTHWNAISEEGVANFVHGVLILCRLVIIKICCRKYVVETFYGATFIY